MVLLSFHNVPHISAEPGKVQHPPVLQCSTKFPGAFPSSVAPEGTGFYQGKKMQVWTCTLEVKDTQNELFSFPLTKLN